MWNAAKWASSGICIFLRRAARKGDSVLLEGDLTSIEIMVWENAATLIKYGFLLADSKLEVHQE